MRRPVREPERQWRGHLHMARRSKAGARRAAVVVSVALMMIVVVAPRSAARQMGLAAEAPSPSGAQKRPDLATRPRFEGGVSRIGSFLRNRLIGRNWHAGCPVGLDDLRHVEVSYWDFKGRVRSGPLVVHEMAAGDVLWVFERLFRAEFAIHRIKLPPAYRLPRPVDWFNTRNRTSSFNCRPATGNPGSLSHHSYGWAIDINPLQNPYVSSSGAVLRRAAKPYTDRSMREPGMIRPGDVVVRSFARIGWEWGGDWVTIKDYMHFSLTGR